MAKLKLGDMLVSCGYITNSQVDMAIVQQSKDKTKRLGEILMDLEFIKEEQLLEALSQSLELQTIDIRTYKCDISAVELVPKSISMKYNIIAIANQNARVTLALNDPLDFYAIEDVKSLINVQCVLVLSKKQDIKDAINKFYSQIDAKKAVNVANRTVDFSKNQRIENLEADNTQAPIVNLINSIILKAHSDGASDIHFEPFEKEIKVRLRIDGQLIEYLSLESNLTDQIATRIKIISELNIAEHRLPQDGHFKTKIDENDIGIRVSTLPTVFGEKLVLRFLAQSIKMDFSESYGMSPDNYEKISKILNVPHGIIYITGPTGSGKTTTLYMMIERMRNRNLNITTIEDPVERNLEGVNQVQINSAAGLTFESGLRAMLRQDPDVILVGETRDKETATIAVSAAITGHVVLSTLHTNDAISSIVRLGDMGIESFLLANSLVGVVAQRLIRKICLDCKEEYIPTEFEKRMIPDATTLYRGRGCHSCNQSGYRGRIGVHEVLAIDKVIRGFITTQANTDTIYDYVRKENKLTFISDNILKLVLEGTTTMEEYMKQISFHI